MNELPMVCSVWTATDSNLWDRERRDFHCNFVHTIKSLGKLQGKEVTNFGGFVWRRILVEEW